MRLWLQQKSQSLLSGDTQPFQSRVDKLGSGRLSMVDEAPSASSDRYQARRRGPLHVWTNKKIGLPKLEAVPSVSAKSAVQTSYALS